MYCSTLVSITYQSRDQYLPSIHSWDSSTWQVLYPIVLFFCVCFCVVLVFFKCIINLTSFLFKFKLFSLLIKQLFSHEMVKVSRLFYLFVCVFLALKWQGNNQQLHYFSPVPKRFTMFFIYFHFSITLHFILKFTLFLITCFMMDLV